TGAARQRPLAEAEGQTDDQETHAGVVRRRQTRHLRPLGPLLSPGLGADDRDARRGSNPPRLASLVPRQPLRRVVRQLPQHPRRPTAANHRATSGEAAYEAFVPIFNEQIRAWDPAAWPELFKQAGAGYVVLTPKPHDGFRLWPSRVPHPTRGTSDAARDVVGE